MRAAPPAWHAQALCAQTDPEAFFPEQGGAQPKRVRRAVMHACATCPVQYECLLDCLASTDSYMYGIWAGTTLETRKQLANGVPVRPSHGPLTGWQAYAAMRHLADGRSHRWVAVAMGMTVECIRALAEEMAA